MKPIIILIVASIEEQEQQELTSIHQIKPILVSHVAKLIKYLYSKSPCCAWMEGLRATHCKPMSWMGALHGEWRIDLHISPTTWSFCSIVFAMIFYYKDFKTPKIIQFGALAGQIQHMASRKVGFTPRPIRYGSPNLLVSSSAALQSAYQV
jgi:hypothetical protein